MLTRKRQVAARIESSEGSIETLTSLDANILAYEPRMNFDPDLFERNPARSTFSRLCKVVGKRPGSFNLRVMLRGSGTATTAPEWIKLLKACGFGESSLYSVDIGSITSGPFLHNETVTGGTSGATARVVVKTSDGVSSLMIVPISGTLEDGEVITGSLSGASATLSSDPTEMGKEYKVITDNIPSLTLANYEDGVRKLLKGARGKVKFGFRNGEPCALDFEFLGVEAGVADVSLFETIAHSSVKPPAFLNASFSMDSHQAKFSEMDIDVGNTLAPHDDPSDLRGISSFSVTDRILNGSYNPEMVLTSTHDFFNKWLSGHEMILDFIIGQTAGNRFRFYGPRVQYTNVADEDREGIATARSQFDLNGSETTGDDELTILSY